MIQYGNQVFENLRGSSGLVKAQNVSFNISVPIELWGKGTENESGSTWYECKFRAPAILDSDFVEIFAGDEATDLFVRRYMRPYVNTSNGTITIYANATPAGPLAFCYMCNKGGNK